MKQKEIKALMVAPKEYPKVVTLKTDLDSLQKAVSIGAGYQGLIEIIHLEKGVVLICNEEGKLNGLEGNGVREYRHLTSLSEAVNLAS